MVSAYAADAVAATAQDVALIRDYLMSRAQGWLTTTGPHMSVSVTALADLVHELLTVRCAAVRTVNGQLGEEIVRMEAELAHARTERDAAMREAQLRESEILELLHERDQLTAQLSTTDGPGVGR